MIVKAEELANLSMEEIIENAIIKEIESYNYYMSAARYVGKQEIRSLLTALASIEEGHKNQLEACLNELRINKEIGAAINLRCEKG